MQPETGLDQTIFKKVSGCISAQAAGTKRLQQTSSHILAMMVRKTVRQKTCDGLRNHTRELFWRQAATHVAQAPFLVVVAQSTVVAVPFMNLVVKRSDEPSCSC